MVDLARGWAGAPFPSRSVRHRRLAAAGARPGCGRWPDWRRRGSHPVGGSPSVAGGSRGLVVLAVSLAARQQGGGRLVVSADLLPGSGGLLAVDSRRRWSSLSSAPYLYELRARRRAEAVRPEVLAGVGRPAYAGTGLRIFSRARGAAHRRLPPTMASTPSFACYFYEVRARPATAMWCGPPALCAELCGGGYCRCINTGS